MTQENETNTGGFDPKRAKKMAGEVTDEFRGKLKKLQRWMFAQLLVFVAAMVFFAMRFLESNHEMLWIAFGVLFLMAYESTVLIKLWYWTVNTKISVVRELKEMRLASGTPAVVATPSDFRGITWWEKIAWMVAIMAVAVLIGQTYRGPNAFGKSEEVLTVYVDLATDGSGKVITKTTNDGGHMPSESYANFMPTESFTVRFTGNDLERVHWYDEQWRELSHDMREVNGERIYTVHWPHPILPDQRTVIYQVLERSRLAINDGDVWTYQGTWTQWLSWPNAWKIVVRLPLGATLMQASPTPMSQGTVRLWENEKWSEPQWHVVLGGKLEGGKQWDGSSAPQTPNVSWKVTYRMLEKPTTRAEAKGK